RGGSEVPARRRPAAQARAAPRGAEARGAGRPPAEPGVAAAPAGRGATTPRILGRPSPVGAGGHPPERAGAVAGGDPPAGVSPPALPGGDGPPAWPGAPSPGSPGGDRRGNLRSVRGALLRACAQTGSGPVIGEVLTPLHIFHTFFTPARSLSSRAKVRSP